MGLIEVRPELEALCELFWLLEERAGGLLSASSLLRKTPTGLPLELSEGTYPVHMETVKGLPPRS